MAIIATVCTTKTYALGGKTRRYVVVPEDEHLFDGEPGSFYFYGQWLRSAGVVDEQVRLLDGEYVTKVKRT